MPPKTQRPTTDAAKPIHVAADELHSAISEMLKDWRDGDFQLPRLAQIHMLYVEGKYREVGRSLLAEEKSWKKFQREVLNRPPATHEPA